MTGIGPGMFFVAWQHGSGSGPIRVGHVFGLGSRNPPDMPDTRGRVLAWHERQIAGRIGHGIAAPISPACR